MECLLPKVLGKLEEPYQEGRGIPQLEHLPFTCEEGSHSSRPGKQGCGPAAKVRQGASSGPGLWITRGSCDCAPRPLGCLLALSIWSCQDSLGLGVGLGPGPGRL